ncbi:uncharacterized protein [Narcine bancroftii]|uniref:uncharacterized protein n=1 Tax=Narcine bancroftii TaxID=1343680 RepID=UPI0038318B96
MPVWDGVPTVPGAHHFSSWGCAGAGEGSSCSTIPQTLHPERPPRVHGDGELLPSFHPQSCTHHAPIVRADDHQRNDFIVVRGGRQGFHCENGGSSQHHTAGAPTAGGAHGTLHGWLSYSSGEVLEQWVNRQCRSLAFFSKQLCPPELKYNAFDLELLMLYLATRHFHYFLEGRPITAFTDHKPLTQALAMAKDPWSTKQQRHLLYVSEFTTDIRHRAGKDNVVADALSRPAINTLVPGLDYEQLAQAQRNDAEMQALGTAILGLKLKDVRVPRNVKGAMKCLIGKY